MNNLLFTESFCLSWVFPVLRRGTRKTRQINCQSLSFSDAEKYSRSRFLVEQSWIWLIASFARKFTHSVRLSQSQKLMSTSLNFLLRSSRGEVWLGTIINKLYLLLRDYFKCSNKPKNRKPNFHINLLFKEEISDFFLRLRRCPSVLGRKKVYEWNSEKKCLCRCCDIFNDDRAGRETKWERANIVKLHKTVCTWLWVGCM